MPAFASPAAPLTYDAIKSLVIAQDIRTVNDLIQALPEDYKQYFVMRYHSNSLQTASPDAPRIIAFGRAPGGAIITWNSSNPLPGEDLTQDPYRGGHSSVEIADLGNGELRFSRIQFAPRDSAPVPAPIFIDTPEQKKKFKLDCAACHGQPAHFIWHGYPHWPGSYGSQDDRIVVSNGDQPRVPAGEVDEYPMFQSFLAKKANDPRYRDLEIGNRTISVDAHGAPCTDPTGNTCRTLLLSGYGGDDYANPNTILTARIGLETARSAYSIMKS